MVADVALEGEHAPGRHTFGGNVDQHGAGVAEQTTRIQRRAIGRGDIDSQSHGPQRVDQEAAFAGRAFDHQDLRRPLHDDVCPRGVVLHERVRIGLELQTHHVMAAVQRLDGQDEAARARLDVHVLVADEAAVDHQIQGRVRRHIGFELCADSEALTFA